MPERINGSAQTSETPQVAPQVVRLVLPKGAMNVWLELIDAQAQSPNGRAHNEALTRLQEVLHETPTVQPGQG